MFFPFKIIKLLIILIATILTLVLLTRFLTPSDELKKADAIVAISGGNTTDRTLHAINLYQEGWAPKIIFSGDAFDPLSPSNADIMKQIATRNNIPSSDIFIEEQSENTQENAANSQNLIQSLGVETIILVTSDYHQRRAYIEFSDKLGSEVEIVNSPAVEDQWNKAWWWTSPRGWYLTTSESVKIPITYLTNLF